MGELTPEQHFREEITNRLREDIGKMLPPEMLRQLVEEAIQKLFFERTTTHTEGYGGKATENPSWLEERVGELLDTAVRAEVARVVENSEPIIAEAVQKFLREQFPAMLAEILSTAIRGVGSSAGLSLGQSFSDSLRELFEANSRAY